MRTDPRGFRNPHTLANRVARLAWSIVWALLFRPTPWFMGAWRAWLLRRFGAKIGYARIHASARVWAPWLLEIGNDVYIDHRVFLYNTFGIKIGDRVVISIGSFLCTATHDYRDPQYELTGGAIVVEDDCWITAETFIGPGVRVGSGAVVGARAVVVKDVAPWTVMAGNPAKPIGQRIMKDSGVVPQASAQQNQR